MADELSSLYRKLLEAQRELADADSELDDAQDELENVQDEYDDAEAEVERLEAEIEKLGSEEEFLGFRRIEGITELETIPTCETPHCSTCPNKTRFATVENNDHEERQYRLFCQRKSA